MIDGLVTIEALSTLFGLAQPKHIVGFNKNCAQIAPRVLPGVDWSPNA